MTDQGHCSSTLKFCF